MTSVAEAVKSAKRAASVTPPTPATGSTVPVIGECSCGGSAHLSDCAHRSDNVNLGQEGAAYTGVTVHSDAYLCACGLYSSPAIDDVRAHQEESGCLS